MRARHGRHGKLCGGGVAKAHGGGVSRRQRVVHGEGEAPKAHAGKRARGGSAKHSVHEAALKAAKALVRHEQEQMQAEAHSRPGKRARGGRWIAGAIRHPGALRKALRVKEGEPIPAAKLDKAAHSNNPTLRKRAALAKTLRSFHH